MDGRSMLCAGLNLQMETSLNSTHAAIYTLLIRRCLFQWCTSVFFLRLSNIFEQLDQSYRVKVCMFRARGRPCHPQFPCPFDSAQLLFAAVRFFVKSSAARPSLPLCFSPMWSHLAFPPSCSFVWGIVVYINLCWLREFFPPFHKYNSLLPHSPSPKSPRPVSFGSPSFL